MRYRAAIFDFDGTLLDTLADLAGSMNSVLEERRLPTHPVDAYRYFVGDGMLNLVRRAAPAGTDEAALRDMLAAMERHYARNWAVETRPYDGISELITALRDMGLRLAILSNKPDAFTKEMAAHYIPAGFFEIVLGARDDVPRKPDPAGALEIAERLAIPPADFLYLGDTNTDMKTGRAAGMFTIGVSWGFRPVSELLEAGAERIVDTPGQILEILN